MLCFGSLLSHNFSEHRKLRIYNGFRHLGYEIIVENFIREQFNNYGMSDPNSHIRLTFDSQSSTGDCSISKSDGEIILLFPANAKPNLKIEAPKENIQSDFPFTIITPEQNEQADNTLLVESREGKITIQAIKFGRFSPIVLRCV